MVPLNIWKPGNGFVKLIRLDRLDRFPSNGVLREILLVDNSSDVR